MGHETDTTLIDFVSDRRAPTPTAAAEIAVPVRMELLAVVADAGARMTRAMGLRLETRSQRLRDLSRALPRAQDLLDGPRQRLDMQGDRLPAALIRLVDRRRLHLSEMAGSLRPSVLVRMIATDRARATDRAARLAPALGRLVRQRRTAHDACAARLSARPILREVATCRERLTALGRRMDDAQAVRLRDRRAALEALARLGETLGYRETLRRGYAVVRGDGQVVTTRAAAEEATGLEIEFADGTLRLGGGSSPRKPGKAPPPGQGSLF